MSKKIHNPKSYAPAVYIPCWLIQVSIKLLSHGAKMTYGRLSQWATSDGTVYRSASQLSQELGCSVRSIEYHLRELKDVELIGTFQPQLGGVNHFEFYDHPWMHEPINDNLVYKQDRFTPAVKSDGTPPQDLAVPPARFCGTPPQDLADINNKEIERNKKNSKPFVDSPKSTGYADDVLFQSFYHLYPNKQKPQQAHKAFLKHKPDKQFVLMLIADIQNRLANNWKGRHKSKIPHPATYLNAKEWEGEIYSPESNITAFPNKPKRYTMDELLGDNL